MGRPLSWLGRLSSIERIAASSARSHFDRKDLQKLFEIQSRSAQNLMAAMPSVAIGRTHLLEKDVLLSFLRGLSQSANPAETYAVLRAKPPKPARRQLRAFSLQDVSADLRKPPEKMTFLRGEIKVRFQTLEELAEAMVYLATILQEDLDTFANQYEPVAECNE